MAHPQNFLNRPGIAACIGMVWIQAICLGKVLQSFKQIVNAAIPITGKISKAYTKIKAGIYIPWRNPYHLAKLIGRCSIISLPKKQKSQAVMRLRIVWIYICSQRKFGLCAGKISLLKKNYSKIVVRHGIIISQDCLPIKNPGQLEVSLSIKIIRRGNISLR